MYCNQVMYEPIYIIYCTCINLYHYHINTIGCKSMLSSINNDQ